MNSLVSANTGVRNLLQLGGDGTRFGHEKVKVILTAKEGVQDIFLAACRPAARCYIALLRYAEAIAQAAALQGLRPCWSCLAHLPWGRQSSAES